MMWRIINFCTSSHQGNATNSDRIRTTEVSLAYTHAGIATLVHWYFCVGYGRENRAPQSRHFSTSKECQRESIPEELPQMVVHRWWRPVPGGIHYASATYWKCRRFHEPMCTPRNLLSNTRLIGAGLGFNNYCLLFTLEGAPRILTSPVRSLIRPLLLVAYSRDRGLPATVAWNSY